MTPWVWHCQSCRNTWATQRGVQDNFVELQPRVAGEHLAVFSNCKGSDVTLVAPEIVDGIIKLVFSEGLSLYSLRFDYKPDHFKGFDMQDPILKQVLLSLALESCL